MLCVSLAINNHLGIWITVWFCYLSMLQGPCKNRRALDEDLRWRPGPQASCSYWISPVSLPGNDQQCWGGDHVWMIWWCWGLFRVQRVPQGTLRPAPAPVRAVGWAVESTGGMLSMGFWLCLIQKASWRAGDELLSPEGKYLGSLSGRCPLGCWSSLYPRKLCWWITAVAVWLSHQKW